MAKKLSITIFVDRTTKNLTFLKTACKKVNKSKRPREDWASCAILSQSSIQAYHTRFYQLHYKSIQSKKNKIN